MNIAVQVSENCKSLRSQSSLEESVREMLNEQTENEEEIYKMLKCIFKKIFARRFKYKNIVICEVYSLKLIIVLYTGTCLR